MPKYPPLQSLTLDGYTLDLGYYLTHEYDDVAEASAELPAMAEWLNEQLQGYVEQLQVKRAELDETEANAYFALTGGEFAENYQGRQTEDSLKHAVAIDPKVRKVKREVAVLSAWCSRLRATADNVRMKLELVRSTEATRRTVFNEGSPS